MVRGTVVRSCLALAMVLAVGSSISQTDSGYEAIASLSGVATASVALLGPPLLGAVWGACNSADAQTACSLAHLPPTRYRLSLLSAGVALISLMAVLVLFAGGVTRLLAPGETAPSTATAAGHALSSGIVLVATVVVVAGWVPAVVMRLEARGAAMVSVALSLLYVVGRLTPTGGALSPLRSLLPITAIEVIDDGREGVPLGLGLLAISALAGWLALAAYVLLGGRLPHRRRRLEAAERLVPRWKWWWTAWLAVGLTTGALVPTAFASLLPISMRPSLLVERVSGVAPDQVAGDYLEALRTSNRAAERRLSVGRPLVSWGPGSREFRFRPPGSALELSQVDRLDEALVHVFLGSVQAYVCLTKIEGIWKVTDVEPLPCS